MSILYPTKAFRTTEVVTHDQKVRILVFYKYVYTSLNDFLHNRTMLGNYLHARYTLYFSRESLCLRTGIFHKLYDRHGRCCTNNAKYKSIRN